TISRFEFFERFSRRFWRWPQPPPVEQFIPSSFLAFFGQIHSATFLLQGWGVPDNTQRLQTKLAYAGRGRLLEPVRRTKPTSMRMTHNNCVIDGPDSPDLSDLFVKNL